MRQSLVALVSGVLGLGLASASATTWDYTADFAVDLPQVGQGSGNAWWYFMAAGNDFDGSYTLFTLDGGGIYTSGASFHYLSAGGGHPGNTPANPMPDIIVGFRASAAGNYAVEGRFTDGNGADPVTPVEPRGVDVSVAHDTATLIGPTHLDAWGFSPEPDFLDFDFVVSLAAGDWLYFRVNDRGQHFFDGTGIEIAIADGASIPAPGGLAVVLGLAGFTATRRRARR